MSMPLRRLVRFSFTAIGRTKAIADNFVSQLKGEILNDKVKDAIFATMVSNANLKEDLMAFLKSVPTTYRDNSIPTAFEPLVIGDLPTKVAVVGDTKLSLQVVIICKCHAALAAAAKVASIRGQSRTPGDGGGAHPIDANSVVAWRMLASPDGLTVTSALSPRASRRVSRDGGQLRMGTQLQRSVRFGWRPRA